MAKYLFNTETTVKSEKQDFYIERDSLPCFSCSAENVKDAIAKYLAFAEKKCFHVSKTAAKKPEKMYDSQGQIGYVFTASTDVEYSCGWRKKYVLLWVEISQLMNPFSEDTRNLSDN